MQKNYRLSKKQEGTFFDYSRGTDLKVQFNSNKKHLPHGALTPPPPSSSYINAKVRWLWMAVKKSPSL